MRQVTMRFKPDELAIVLDYMRQAKEVFQRTVYGAVKGDEHEDPPQATQGEAPEGN
jgi:hypothetical protein